MGVTLVWTQEGLQEEAAGFSSEAGPATLKGHAAHHVALLPNAHGGVFPKALPTNCHQKTD